MKISECQEQLAAAVDAYLKVRPKDRKHLDREENVLKAIDNLVASAKRSDHADLPQLIKVRQLKKTLDYLMRQESEKQAVPEATETVAGDPPPPVPPPADPTAAQVGTANGQPNVQPQAGA